MKKDALSKHRIEGSIIAHQLRHTWRAKVHELLFGAHAFIPGGVLAL